ncbi:elongation factor G [Kordia sp. SMS9]|uniref:elongation factor G n=1 Tax=Kordia sp. SMS9 TaxID=2282170 RepID=UPI000E0D7946|nr:elongation factor G [Kordia sp. SMS9]AXG71386.1 elongation factor G [Kordia sp. SMS9]
MKRLKDIRNIGIIAHVDAGKTTTTERILYYTGTIHKPGNIDDGNTVTDSDVQEASRGISISSSAISADWEYNEKIYQINIIDTPGHIDFAIEVERSLRILDGAVALFCAASGVESQSETVWSQSERYGIPKIGFINKMDRIGADYFKVLSQIEEEFGATTLPIQIPIGDADDFEGVIDLLQMKAIYWNADDYGKSNIVTDIPKQLVELAEKWRAILLERIANFDDAIMEQYLEDTEISIDDLQRAIRRITLERKAVPMLCGSAYKYIGVQPLLDAVANYLPQPQDIESVDGIDMITDEKATLACTVDEQLSAFVFKVIVDKYVGKLAMVRLYSGSIDVGTQVLNSRTNAKNRVSRILSIQADKFKELSLANAGDIVALIGLKNVKTGDTLCELGKPFSLESIEVSEAVISLAIEPVSKNDEKNFGDALSKLLDEDPSLRASYDSQTGQTLLHGMGELHLEVRIEKLKTDYGVAINKGNPKVSYRELLTTSVTHTELLKKQTGGSGSFAEITFTMQPRTDAEKGLLFVNETKGGVISKDCINATEKGFREAMQSGILLEYPLEAMKITLLDGKMHENDSSSSDFETVARQAFRVAAKQANPVLLEPIMIAEINCPEDYLGNVTSDINKRRGMIVSIKENGNRRKVNAEIPLLQTFGYISSLRTLTSGKGSVTLKLKDYKQVPEHVLNQLVC